MPQTTFDAEQQSLDGGTPRGQLTLEAAVGRGDDDE